MILCSLVVFVSLESVLRGIVPGLVGMEFAQIKSHNLYRNSDGRLSKPFINSVSFSVAIPINMLPFPGDEVAASSCWYSE